jgi:hypothetical protein
MIADRQMKRSAAFVARFANCGGHCPFLRRGGFHNALFDACSAFTRVTAWTLAKPP